jgi:hypothetical protein
MSDVGRRLGLAHPDHGVDSVWTEQFQIHPNIKGVLCTQGIKAAQA